jgi:hypothetical protein
MEGVCQLIRQWPRSKIHTVCIIRGLINRKNSKFIKLICTKQTDAHMLLHRWTMFAAALLRISSVVAVSPNQKMPLNLKMASANAWAVNCWTEKWSFRHDAIHFQRWWRWRAFAAHTCTCNPTQYKIKENQRGVVINTLSGRKYMMFPTGGFELHKGKNLLS